jgi:hypothetical protein
MQAPVQTRYGLPPLDDETYAIRRQANRLAVAVRGHARRRWSATEKHETLGNQTLAIDIPLFVADPLAVPKSMRPRERWPAPSAAVLFLAKLPELSASGSSADPDATGYRTMLRVSRAETTKDKLENVQELIALAGASTRPANCWTMPLFPRAARRTKRLTAPG